MITVRAAVPTDVTALHALIGELAVYENLEHEMVATEADTFRHLFGPTNTAEALIAEHAGFIAGFAIFYPFYSTFAGRPGLYLEDVYVRSEFRRRGIGKALLQHFLAVAQERGCAKAEWRVLRWNDPALAFYRSFGATVLEEWVTVQVVFPQIPKSGGE